MNGMLSYKNSIYDCQRLLKYADNAEADFTSLLIQRTNNRRRKRSNSLSNADIWHNDTDNIDDPIASFGHPDPPNLVMFRVTNDNINTNNDDSEVDRTSNSSCIVLVAYTQHTISAQILADNEIQLSTARNKNKSTISFVSSNPIEVCMLVVDIDDDNDDTNLYEIIDDEDEARIDEQITCLTIVEMENLDLILSATKGNKNDSIHVDEAEDGRNSIYDEKITEDSGPFTNNPWRGSFTSASSYIDEHDNNNSNAAVQLQHRLAIVFGTNNSRLLTVELNVKNIGSRQQNDSSTNHDNEGNDNCPWRIERVSTIIDTTDPSTKPITESSTLFQVLPTDANDTTESIQPRESRMKRLSPFGKSSKRKSNENIPFSPSGSIQSLTTFRIPNQQNRWDDDTRTSVYVWVTYCDGSVIRLHHASFFPSVWKKCADEGKSVEDLLYENVSKTVTTPVVCCKLHVPPVLLESPSTVPIIVPLPQYHPSPLGGLTLSPFHNVLMDGASDDDQDSEDGEDVNGVSATTPVMEAIVFGQGGPSDVFPTFCFYSSEQHHVDMNQDTTKMGPAKASADGSSVLGSVTKALLGSTLGAFRWGFASSSSTKIDSDNTPMTNSTLDGNSSHHLRSIDDFPSFDADVDMETPTETKNLAASSPFPSLWKQPIDLYAGVELHDAPRQIEFCSVDPDGELAAATDGLGRVLLIELESKQIIRMWKGYREAKCYWHQALDPEQTDRISLYLVIHSRQRRIVEAWKVRHGGRVLSKQVGRDAHVITSTTCLSRDFELSMCYIIHSRVPGTATNHIEQIDIDGTTNEQSSSIASLVNRPSKYSLQRQSSDASVTSVKSATLKIQHLQQLLSTTAVEFSIEDVKKSLHDIKSLSDLSTALDLLASGSVLESRLAFNDTSLYKSAVSYCTEVLNKATRASGDHHLSTNPHVRLLAHKITYYTQIISAYDLLHRFQNEHDMNITEYPQTKNPSQWAAEAMAWAKTYEQVTGTNLDSLIPAVEESPSITFTKFASCCAFPNVDEPFVSKKAGSKLSIYFNESSRTRREILEQVFQPLLCDVFSFNVVYSILDALRIRDDSKYIQQCFSEWFMILPLMEAYNKGIHAENPPMLRLLLDLVSVELESDKFSDSTVVLKVIHKFCESSTDLVRAFILASLCREAVAVVVARKEKASYGKIQTSRVTKEWTSLLRKLRVCLLVTLRLHGMRLAAPVTINNVMEEGLFSVFEWLALDELQMTHDHLQIVSLEKACAISSYSFDPSLPDGDGPARFRMLQNSCLSASISEDERAEYLVDFEDDDRFGALLLFLRNHNIPPILAAHRVLLLAAKWSSNPNEIKPLQDGIVSLRSLHMTQGLESLAAAVCLEVWHTRLCPIFRAHLFGFDDVQEVTEEIVAPLLKSREWLIDVGKIALQVLAILKLCKLEVDANSVFDKLLAGKATKTWPPVREDAALRRLLEKTRPIDSTALDAHSVIVCALLVSGDVDSLVQCVPAIYDCFISQALFKPMTTSGNVRELQRSYLDNALFGFARDYAGPVMEVFELGEIHTLANVWSFDLKSVHTLFILAMYEYGKDRVIDELLTKAAASIHVHRFVESGVDIACRRLKIYLYGSKKHAAGMHEVMSLLDADICEWIMRRATESKPLVDNPDLEVPIGSTHLFIMRLLSLSASANVDATLRVKIHSLVVLSGILVKALSGTSGLR